MGEYNTLDRIQRYFSLVLFPQWCILCRKHEEDLDHLFWDCQFARYFLSWESFCYFLGHLEREE